MNSKRRNSELSEHSLRQFDYFNHQYGVKSRAPRGFPGTTELQSIQEDKVFQGTWLQNELKNASVQGHSLLSEGRPSFGIERHSKSPFYGTFTTRNISSPNVMEKRDSVASNTSPSRSSRLKILKERDSVSLQRTLSWPIENNTRTSYLFAHSKSPDIAIYSSIFLKKNRYGSFQRRVIRYDGTLFVCMSASKGKTTTRKPILEDNLSETRETAINTTFCELVKEYYPVGSTMPSLAHALISKGTRGDPDPNSFKYYVPKWVIPTDSIKGLITNVDEEFPESDKSRTFRLVTNTNTYIFQTGTSKELVRFKYMVETAMYSRIQPQNEHAFVSDSVLISQEQTQRMQHYLVQQNHFKRVLHSIIKHDEHFKKQVCTVQVNLSSGNIALNGVVLQPQNRTSVLESNGNASLLSTKRRNGADPPRNTSVATLKQKAMKRNGLQSFNMDSIHSSPHLAKSSTLGITKPIEIEKPLIIIDKVSVSKPSKNNTKQDENNNNSTTASFQQVKQQVPLLTIQEQIDELDRELELLKPRLSFRKL